MTNPLPITVTDPDLTPTRATDGSAGYDLYADIDMQQPLPPGWVVTIPTGVSMAIPADHVGLLCARSSYAKHDVTLANSIGVIDADYRGEIKVKLSNHGAKRITINPRDRIAQILIVPITTPQLQIVPSLNHTHRGTGGFGSTGR